MQTLLPSFFIIIVLSFPKPSNGLEVSEHIDDVLGNNFQDYQIARKEGGSPNDQLESRGVTIWLGPHWIAPGGGRQHLQSFGKSLARQDSAMLLLGKRR